MWCTCTALTVPYRGASRGWHCRARPTRQRLTKPGSRGLRSAQPAARARGRRSRSAAAARHAPAEPVLDGVGGADPERVGGGGRPARPCAGRGCGRRGRRAPASGSSPARAPHAHADRGLGVPAPAHADEVEAPAGGEPPRDTTAPGRGGGRGRGRAARARSRTACPTWRPRTPGGRPGRRAAPLLWRAASQGPEHGASGADAALQDRVQSGVLGAGARRYGIGSGPFERCSSRKARSASITFVAPSCGQPSAAPGAVGVGYALVPGGRRHRVRHVRASHQDHLVGVLVEQRAELLARCATGRSA